MPEPPRETPEIVVTPEMVAAGIEELFEHKITNDWAYVVECVFRAMAYASKTVDNPNA